MVDTDTQTHKLSPESEDLLAKKDDHFKPFSPPGIDGALSLIFTRNFFYQKNYRNILKICLILILIISLQAGLIYYLKSTQNRPIYFATTLDGDPVDLIPLDQPNMTNNELLRWANHAAVASYTFNFANYRSALQSVRKYYTATGYQKYLKALKDSNNLNAVKAKKYVVSAIATSTPKIIKQKTAKNKDPYSWIIQIPMLLTYQNSNAEDTRNQEVTMLMLVRRLDLLESVDGIGIAQLIVSEGHSDVPFLSSGKK